MPSNQPRPGARAAAPKFAPAVAPSGVPTGPSRYVRKKKPLWKSPGFWIFVIALGACGGGGAWFLTQKSLTLVSPGDQQITENDSMRLTLQARTKGLKPGDYQFELVKGPPGAAIDPQSGLLSWTPTEAQGQARYDVQIRVAAKAFSLPPAEVSFAIVVDEDSQPPVLAAIPEQTLDLNSTKVLTVALQAADADLPAQKLKYELVSGQQYGATLDAATGLFTFDGSAAKPNQTFGFTVAVFDSEKVASKAVSFNVKIIGSPPAYDQFVEKARKAGLKLTLTGAEPVPLFAVGGKVHSIDNQRLIVYEFPTKEAAATAAAEVLPDASAVGSKPIPFAREAEVYVDDRLIFVYLGSAEPGARLADLLGRRLADRTPVVASLPTTTPTTTIEPNTPKISEFEPLIKLYKEKKLFSLKEYAKVRKFYADRFAAANADLIRQIFGDDAALAKFFEKNPDVKEELFTAIDPKYDNVAAVLTLFRDLHRQFPAKFRAYSELAIATAVTWDNEKQVVDYATHQQRAKATMPVQQTTAFENFKYLLDAEPVMQGRIQFTPWEFLLHNINDRTPIAERMWAVQNYLPKRVMFGECYRDCPYDTDMLTSNSQICRLEGKEYTLANLQQFGGVCAHQADYASRVGKAIGVPAEYVSGAGNTGIPHAWVMWVELKQVTAGGIVFSLESYGRYDYDFYYVGTLRDPQTGQRITDRQLELRLQTTGMNVPAKRHADRIMAAYSAIRDELKFPVKEQLAFLDQLLKLCVGNEAAWHEVAAISKNETLEKKDEAVVVAALDVLFRMFAKVPDFTWEIFDDLIGFRKDEKDKIALYQRLVQLYDDAKRPDLACNAVMVLADKMATQNQQLLACQGIMATILRYPEEGRHVPKLIDQLDKLSQGIAGADAAFVTFYQKFLPNIPRERSQLPSPYCIAMYQRGIKKYRATGNEALAAEAEVELEKIKAIGKPKT